MLTNRHLGHAKRTKFRPSEFPGNTAFTRENLTFLAARMVAFRAETGLTQWQSAELCDVSSSLWAAYEVNCFKDLVPNLIDSPIRRIVNLVLKISPECHKARIPTNGQAQEAEDRAIRTYHEDRTDGVTVR